MICVTPKLIEEHLRLAEFMRTIIITLFLDDGNNDRFKMLTKMTNDHVD